MDDQEEVLQDDAAEVVETSHAGVLIDNNTGEEAKPTPINVAGIGDKGGDDEEQEDVQADADGADQSDADNQDGTDDGNAETATQQLNDTATQQQQADDKQPEQVDDPGDFTPGDYAFDVTLADGTTVRIDKPEDIEKLPQDADFGTPKNFLEVQANYSKMVTGIEADKRTHEASKQAYDDQQAAHQEADATLATWVSELTYLETKGVLPKVAAEFETADWTDPEVAKQPGVKERVELFNFMGQETAARDKAGLPRIKSVLEAQGLMERDALKTQQVEHEQKQVDLRKKRGAMVAGQSAPAPNKGNSDMIVGSGGSLRDI